MPITQKENELLTQTGKGTPMGDLFRQYWMPAMLSERLPEPEGRPVAIQLLGEKLVAFRDRNGKVFIIDEFCPHRRASLAYARCEDGGLRCIFHGWLIGGDGRAWEAPPERQPERFARNVRTTAYPTHEAGSIIWVYMGEGAPPPPPDFRFTPLSDDHLYAVHYLQECNYLQGIEADVDLAHSSYLHSSVSRKESALGGAFPVADVLAYDGAPTPHAVDTEWGFWNVWQYRTPDPDRRMYWAHPFVFPFFTTVGPSRRDNMYVFHAWVPVNDEQHMFYYVHFNPDRPFTEQDRAAIAEMFGHDMIDKSNGYRSIATLANHHLQDAERMRTLNYSGIKGIATQDIAVLQSMGPIVDRTKEHLGSEDGTVRWLRRRLMTAATQHAAGEGVLPGSAPTTRRSELDGFICFVGNDVSWRDVAADTNKYHTKRAE